MNEVKFSARFVALGVLCCLSFSATYSLQKNEPATPKKKSRPATPRRPSISVDQVSKPTINSLVGDSAKGTRRTRTPSPRHCATPSSLVSVDEKKTPATPSQASAVKSKSFAVIKVPSQDLTEEGVVYSRQRYTPNQYRPDSIQQQSQPVTPVSRSNTSVLITVVAARGQVEVSTCVNAIATRSEARQDKQASNEDDDEQEQQKCSLCAIT